MTDILELKRKQILIELNKRKLSENQLAEKTKVDRSNLNQFLAGNGRMSLQKLIPVLKYLGINIT